MSEELHRDIGRHDAEIASLKAELAEVKQDVKSMLAILNQAQGGWRLLVIVGGLFAMLGSVVGWFVSTFVHK